MISDKIYQMWPIILNVWKSAMRDKTIYALVLFGVTCMLVSLIFGDIVMGTQERFIQTVGYWAQWLVGLICIVYLGVSSISDEIKTKTIYLLLSRPVGRELILLGKYFGIALTLVTICFLLMVVHTLLMLIHGISISVAHFVTIGFIFLECMFLLSVCSFFSVITTPVLHSIFVVSVAFLGHWVNDIKVFSMNADTETGGTVLLILYHIIPNLESINFRTYAIYGDPISTQTILSGMTFIVLWTMFFLTMATIIFKRKVHI